MIDNKSSSPSPKSLSLNVVDFGAGMASALISQMIADLGGRIVRPERLKGDPCEERYPAHIAWREKVEYLDDARIEVELARADLCIIGGESHPDIVDDVDPQNIAVKHPNIVVLNLQGFVSDERRDAPANDIIAQALTGLCFEQYSDRAALYACPAPTYGMTILGLIGAFAALVERETSGLGQVVTTSLEQGALMWVKGAWNDSRDRDFVIPGAAPKDTQAPVYECADGKFVVSLFGVPGSVAGTYRALEIDEPVDPKDRGLPDASRGSRNYYAVRDILEPAFGKFTRENALEALWREKIPADAVMYPGESWDEEQVRANDLIGRSAAGWRAVRVPFKTQITPCDAGRVFRAPELARNKRGPLAGLRVVDFGAFVAGPFSAKLLGDLGADVIKVEPATGDPMRPIERPFTGVSRGKRSIALNLKQLDDLVTFRRVCATADALVHNLRVGVVERLGLAPADLQAESPHLINAHATAFGLHGPKATNSGFDPILQGLTGHAFRMGGEGNPPEIYNVPLLDYGVGGLTAAAILYGVLARKRVGEVYNIQTSLLATGLYLMSELIEMPDGKLKGATGLNPQQTALRPQEQLYRAQGGWLAIAVQNEGMARSLCQVLNLSLRPLDKWDDNETTAIAQAVANQPARSLVEALQEKGVWAAQCCTSGLSALQASVSARAAGLCVEGTNGDGGAVVSVGPLVRFSRTDVDVAMPRLPAVGEDTADVLAEIGAG